VRTTRKLRGHQQRWTKGSFRDPSVPIGASPRGPAPVPADSPWSPEREPEEDRARRAARDAVVREGMDPAPF